MLHTYLSSMPILISALVSFALAQILVAALGRHGYFAMDWPGAVQKFHVTPVPRIGGVGVFVALLLARLSAGESDTGRILDTILIAGAPALVAGLAEDVTKRVGPALRLTATMLSGVAACGLTGIVLTRLQIPMVDAAIQWPLVGLVLTVFAVAGVSNAFNIIDGFNGLASGTAALCLLCISAIAATVGDSALMLAAITIAAAIAGFWLVNFPWGKLFLGDGGAYFAGFALAWLAVLLPVRNPAVSPWACFLVCAYPITEVIYSVVRRWRTGRSAAEPDCAHLHSLVARHVIQRHLPQLNPTLQNSAVSVLMWFCAAIPALLGVTFYDRTPWLVLAAACCFLLYHWLYRYVARA
jgi:UDP-N-acetylmuramyl pentapeptide phosphotransferase/UDP-N-acetylglucosamine-1-phosphate transferase